VLALQRFKRSQRQCPHHWHPIESGWTCCGCPARVKAKASVAPPEPGGAACQAEPGRGERLTDWLAPARPLPATRLPRPHLRPSLAVPARLRRR
jgi:hypothetical protein